MVNTPQPTVQEVREELDRLLEDTAFRRAPSHSRLLRYLVERKTAGDDGALCEAAIAMAVFQRDPASYDAEIDPIVRVSIGRLRGRLEKHYQHFERAPAITIMLPKGRYTPEFRHWSGATAPRTKCGLAVMGTLNLTGDVGLDALARDFSERLSEALVLMGISRVMAPAPVLPPQNTTATALEIGRQLGASEIIETAVSLETHQRLRLSARLIHVADSELAWAEVRMTTCDQAQAGLDALFDAVLARFTAAPGTSAPRSDTSLPNALLPIAARSKIESARMLITHLSVASIERARTLLAEVITDFPDAVDAWALLGRSCVRRINYGDVPAQPLVAQLCDCTRNALALDPNHIEALALRALQSHWSAALSQAESPSFVKYCAPPRITPAPGLALSGCCWVRGASTTR